MSQTLTPRQSEILAYMHEYHSKYLVWPSFREIMSQFKFKSQNAVMVHMKSLEKKGYVTHDKFLARSWRPLRRCMDVTCPHCGGEIEVIEELS